MRTTTITIPDRTELDDPHCLHPDDAVALLTGAPWRRLAIMGDSIAAGIGDPVDGYADLPWAGRLADALTRAVDSVDAVDSVEHTNLGVPGLHMNHIRETQLAPALAFGPDLAVVTGGGNDMMRPTFDHRSVGDDLDAVVGALVDVGATVVTFGLLDLSRIEPVPETLRADLRERLIRLNGVTKAVTRRHGGVHVNFFNHPALDDSLFSADLLHPNRRGHAVIAATTIRALAALVPA